MDDQGVLGRIEQLVEEEHALQRKAGAGGLSDEEHERMRAIEVQLDQCWDLMRQRRARREFGQDPDDARARNVSTVEGYLQ